MSKSEVAAMELTISEPPCVGIQVDTTLGPGRLLYPIKDERWIVLVGTKGYSAEVTVEDNIEEIIDDNVDTAPGDTGSDDIDNPSGTA